MELAATYSEGASGGILMWDNRVLQLVGVEESCFTLSCRFRNSEDNFTWVFTGVYGLVKREQREDLWGELGVVKGLWGDAWCKGGDFNVVRFPGERNRDGRLTGPKRRFSQVIEDLELKDLTLRGGTFTWRGGLGNQRMARLDRFLVLEDLDMFFGGVNQSILPNLTFDHFPILLYGGDRPSKGPMPFRLENMWLKEEGFHSLIADWWTSFDYQGSRSYVVMEKLKALKVKLKIWNKEIFSNVEERKKEALQKIVLWDDIEGH